MAVKLRSQVLWGAFTVTKDDPTLAQDNLAAVIMRHDPSLSPKEKMACEVDEDGSEFISRMDGYKPGTKHILQWKGGRKKKEAKGENEGR